MGDTKEEEKATFVSGYKDSVGPGGCCVVKVGDQEYSVWSAARNITRAWEKDVENGIPYMVEESSNRWAHIEPHTPLWEKIVLAAWPWVDQ